MDLNVAVSTASELFEDSDMVFPILMGRENLKILASPGSESSGVSSLDAEEAKKLANEQLPSSSSPTLVSEPTSAVQTESESSDASSDADDDKPTEQSSTESEQSSDEKDQQSDASDDEDKGDAAETKDTTVELANDSECDSEQPEQVTLAAAQDDDKAAIDLDEIRYKNLKIIHRGRDILDFSANVANKSWAIQYAHLPEQNYQMYINNRSQYNRLASGYMSPGYALNRCAKCAFHFPVLADAPDKVDQPQKMAARTDIPELIMQTIATVWNRRDSPVQNMSAHKIAPTSFTTGQTMNLNNYIQHNNGGAVGAVNAAAATSGQSYAYQNLNRNQFANVGVANASTNNSNFNNAFYGTNMLNALVNKIGNNMNNSSAFNSNFMNALNGTNNSSNSTNQLNQLNGLANLMSQNRQQQMYGMCRQNINKSGINFNANSHKSMPTYSHF